MSSSYGRSGAEPSGRRCAQLLERDPDAANRLFVLLEPAVEGVVHGFQRTHEGGDAAIEDLLGSWMIAPRTMGSFAVTGG